MQKSAAELATNVLYKLAISPEFATRAFLNRAPSLYRGVAQEVGSKYGPLMQSNSLLDKILGGVGSMGTAYRHGKALEHAYPRTTALIKKHPIRTRIETIKHMGTPGYMDDVMGSIEDLAGAMGGR